MGFFAVLAASLFAVFLFTVFGGYSLLLWCQQSLLMVVPPAVVLAVLVWTFLKMDDKITALQKQVEELEAAQKKRRRVREINTATPLQKKLFLQGRRSFYTLLFILWVIQSFEHHHAQNCKAGAQHKTHCPHRHAEQNAHSNTEQDTRDLTFLHFTALPFRTRPPTAAKRGSTAPERSVQCPAEPVAERPAAEGSGPGRPHWRTRQTPSEPQPGRP